MTNFAMVKYSTENIGDEVQAIAARRFLPKIDDYVDRDRFSEYNPAQKTKLIANAWYIRNPKAWPIKSENVNPLLVAMHISTKDKDVVNAFLTQESKDFLNKFGPVGARDETTKDFLIENGIDSYFSGCMTLTLQRDEKIKKREFVLAVDVPRDVLDVMRKNTDREVIDLSVYHFPFLSTEDRFFVAEYFLALYQSAAAIVTTRLHCMLPSLALETPVFLIKDSERYEPKRYAGLDNLVRNATDKEYIDNPSIFDLNNPTENSKEYLKIRERLIKTAQDFTGFSNDETFATRSFSDDLFDLRFIRSFAFGWNSTFKKALVEGDFNWKSEQYRDIKQKFELTNQVLDEKNEKIKNIESENKKLKDELGDIKSSKIWRTAQRIAEIKNKLIDRS